MPTTTMNSSISQLRGLPGSVPSVAWWLDRLPVVVLAVSVVFLQGFAIKFWEDLLGTSGWGVSLGLEVLHLWFWYRAAISARFARVGWIAFAVVATALLLAGALHEVTRPLLQESVRVEASAQERLSLKTEAQVLTANLAAFRNMAAAQGRRGWQADIRRDTARLQAITDQRRSLTANADNRTRFPWLNQITQGRGGSGRGAVPDRCGARSVEHFGESLLPQCFVTGAKNPFGEQQDPFGLRFRKGRNVSCSVETP